MDKEGIVEMSGFINESLGGSEGEFTVFTNHERIKGVVFVEPRVEGGNFAGGARALLRRFGGEGSLHLFAAGLSFGQI